MEDSRRHRDRLARENRFARLDPSSLLRERLGAISEDLNKALVTLYMSLRLPVSGPVREALSAAHSQLEDYRNYTFSKIEPALDAYEAELEGAYRNRRAGDVIPFSRRTPRNPHVETIAGDRYVLSTYAGHMGVDLAEVEDGVEEGDGGARVIRQRPDDPWRYLWAYDTERQVVAMWNAAEGNEKVFSSARSQASLLVRLDSKGQLNRVTTAQFRAIEREMGVRAEKLLRNLEKWVEESKTDSQREVDSLVREYFDRVVRPVMDGAVRNVDQGALPLGFKVNRGSLHSVERQAKAFVTGEIYRKLFDLDQVDAYVSSKGVDLDQVDIQATQYARDDVWMEYAKSILR